MLYRKRNIYLLVSHFALKRNLGADYMRWAGPLSQAGSVCQDLSTSVKHTKIQLRNYMEKFQPG